MAYQVRRDFVGYGANPPDPKWPDGARLAVNFVLNYEEGSEPSVQDGEGHTDTGLTDAHGMGQTIQGRDLAGESLFEYGSRVGFWRINRLFRERGLPMTIYGCGLAFERNPAVSAAIKDAGYDICSHGWRWIKHYELSEEEEREHIRKAIVSTEKMIGERPEAAGTFAATRTGREHAPPRGRGRRLPPYDSDLLRRRPAPFLGHGRRQARKLVVPSSLTNNDGKYMIGIGNSDQWFALVKDAFDMLYREGATQPKMMSVGMHCRLLGHAARAVGLERILDYMGKHKGVWITKRVEIAKHWLRRRTAP